MGAALQGCVTRFNAEQPVTGQFTEPPKPMESMVEIPVAMDINKLRLYLNKQIPKKLYSGREKGTETAEFKEGIFYVTKDYTWEADFTVERNGEVKFDVLKDGSFRFRIPLRIRCEACASVWLATTIRKCGYSNPEIDLIVSTKVGLRPDWSITNKSDLNFDIRQAILKIPFDIAGFPLFTYSMNIKKDLQEPMEKELKAYTGELDKMIADEFKALNVKGMVSEVWKSAFEPQKVNEDPPVWVMLRPKKVFLGDFVQKGTKLILPLGMSAEIAVGTEPASSKPTPLPNLSPPENPGKLSLFIPVAIDYQTLANEVKKELKDCTFTEGKHSVTIKDVAMSGTSNAILIDLTIEAKGGKLFKKVSGHVHLLAVPAYDKKFRRVFLQHFELTSQTNKALIDKNLGWLTNKVFYERIIKEAKYNIGPLVEEQRDYVNGFLKEIKYDMLKASGKIERIELEGIYLQPDKMHLYFSASGAIKSEVVLD
jgi:hypothetical protein